MKGLNLVFAGTPEFGIPCLQALLSSSHQLQAVYTQPDRPSGRGRKLQASAVKEWARVHQLPVFQPVNFKNPETVEELASLKPDVMIVIAYGLILPKAVLDIPRYGCINVHASLLPSWRGASPIQHAVLHGDAKSGVTIMQMDAGMDTGAAYCIEECLVTATETAGSLHDKLALLSPAPLLATLDALMHNKAQIFPQNNELASYAGKISKDDAHIHWQKSAIEIDRLIRAFNPWPIAFTLLGGEVLRIHQAQCVVTESLQAPGTVVALDKKGMLIATGFNQTLLVEKIQFPGAKVISIADWLNSGKTQLYEGLIL